MKISHTILTLGACALLVSHAAAQEVARGATPPASVTSGTVATDESGKAVSVDGSVALFGENAIMLRSGTSNYALPYQFSNDTAWVDEGGNPVTRESMRPGVPISLYFDRNADGLVVSKAVVHPIPTPVSGAAATRAATTRAATPAAAETAFQLTGTIAEKGEDSITLRADAAPSPLRLRYSSTTQWMDGAGHTVTPESVETGVLAMVYYSRGTTGLVISKIVVGRPPVQAVENPAPTNLSGSAASDAKAAPEERPAK